MHFDHNGASSAGDTIVLNDLTFTDIETFNGDTDEAYGGVFYFNCESIDSVTLTEVVASDFESETHGGFFYFDSFAGDLIIDGRVGAQQTTFTGFTAPTAGSFLYSHASDIDIFIYNTVFECDSTKTAASIATEALTIFSDNPASPARAGALYIEDPSPASPATVTVTSQGNQYRYCAIADAGAIYSLKDVPDFDEDQSIYEHNASITGGAVKCDGCTMTINDATFEFNYANQGGTFIFDNDATATIDNTDITDSSSYGDGGAIAAIKTTLDVIGNT